MVTCLTQNSNFCRTFSGTFRRSFLACSVKTTRSIYTTTFVHESFHLHQQPFYGDSSEVTAWPAWGDFIPQRDLISQNCYKPSSEIEALFHQEKNNLAKDVFSKDISDDERKLLFGAFVSTRNARYSKLSGTKISNPARPLETIGCADAENAMEMAEGIPEYVGIGTALEIKAISMQQAWNYALLKPLEESSYYAFGMLQMLALKNFGKQPITQVSEHLAHASSLTDNIFATFSSEFSRNSTN